MLKSIFLTSVLASSWIFGQSQDKKILLIGGDFSAMFSSNNISALDITTKIPNAGGFTPGNLMGTYGDNSGDYKTLYLELNPDLLIYVTDKLLVGLGFDLINERDKYESELITKSIMTTFLLSPEIRYYIYQGFYGQLQYNVGKAHDKIVSNNLSIPTSTGFRSVDYSTIIDGNTQGFGLTAGCSIPLGNNVIADLALKYILNSNKFKYDNKSEEGTYNLKQNMAMISFGLKYILR
jgi:opacity protein-like surface antigen